MRLFAQTFDYHYTSCIPLHRTTRLFFSQRSPRALTFFACMHAFAVCCWENWKFFHRRRFVRNVSPNGTTTTHTYQEKGNKNTHPLPQHPNNWLFSFALVVRARFVFVFVNHLHKHVKNVGGCDAVLAVLLFTLNMELKPHHAVAHILDCIDCIQLHMCTLRRTCMDSSAH